MRAGLVALLVQHRRQGASRAKPQPEGTARPAVRHARQEELLLYDRFFPTPYAARQGWVSLRIDGDTDWGEVLGLVHEAYRQVALKRMLKALDAGP